MKSLFFSSIILISSIYSIPPPGCPDITLPRIPDPCGHQVIPPPCICGYNTPARIDTRGCMGIYLSGSFIYWMPKLEGIDLGILADTEFGEVIERGKVVNFDYDYKPGFKVGISFLYDFDHWECEAEYTYYHTKQNKSKDGNICPKWLNIEFMELVNNFIGVSASWEIDYDLIDLHFARNYYVGKKLTLRPHFGGQALFLKQSFQAEYSANPVEPLPNTISTLVSKNHSNANSYGTRAGIESNWIFGETFRIVGAVSASILYTDYDVSTKQFLKNFPEVLRTDIDDNNFWCLRPHAEMRFGLAYGDYFCCDRFFLDFGLFYEFNVLWNQNVFLFITDETCPRVLQNGDLYLHGLTFTLKWAF